MGQDFAEQAAAEAAAAAEQGSEASPNMQLNSKQRLAAEEEAACLRKKQQLLAEAHAQIATMEQELQQGVVLCNKVLTMPQPSCLPQCKSEPMSPVQMGDTRINVSSPEGSQWSQDAQPQFENTRRQLFASNSKQTLQDDCEGEAVEDGHGSSNMAEDQQPNTPQEPEAKLCEAEQQQNNLATEGSQMAQNPCQNKPPENRQQATEEANAKEAPSKQNEDHTPGKDRCDAAQAMLPQATPEPAQPEATQYSKPPAATPTLPQAKAPLAASSTPRSKPAAATPSLPQAKAPMATTGTPHSKPAAATPTLPEAKAPVTASPMLHSKPAAATPTLPEAKAPPAQSVATPALAGPTGPQQQTAAKSSGSTPIGSGKAASAMPHNKPAAATPTLPQAKAPNLAAPPPTLAVINKRLLRVMEPTSKGVFKVSEDIRQQWQSGNKQGVIKLFAACNYNSDGLHQNSWTLHV